MAPVISQASAEESGAPRTGWGRIDPALTEPFSGKIELG
jgi:hypothetical protein